MQEEERERRMDYVPDESAVSTELIEVRLASEQEAPLPRARHAFLGWSGLQGVSACLPGKRAAVHLEALTSQLVALPSGARGCCILMA